MIFTIHYLLKSNHKDYKELDTSNLLGHPYLLVEVQEAAVNTTTANMAITATTRFIIEFFCILFTLLNILNRPLYLDEDNKI